MAPSAPSAGLHRRSKRHYWFPGPNHWYCDDFPERHLCCPQWSPCLSRPDQGRYLRSTDGDTNRESPYWSQPPAAPLSYPPFSGTPMRLPEREEDQPAPLPAEPPPLPPPPPPPEGLGEEHDRRAMASWQWQPEQEEYHVDDLKHFV